MSTYTRQCTSRSFLAARNVSFFDDDNQLSDFVMTGQLRIWRVTRFEGFSFIPWSRGLRGQHGGIRLTPVAREG